MAHKSKIFPPLLGFLLPFLVAGAAVGGQNVNFRLQAKLLSCCGDPEPEGEGKAEYRTQTVKGQLKQERFRAEVKIPVPSAGLNIADAAAARNADVRVSLSGGGGVYAVCSLEFVEFEVKNDFDDGVLIESETSAVYLVDVLRQQRKGGYLLRELSGSCDIDTASVNTQNGVPAVSSGDIAAATVVSSGNTDFLDGALAE